LNVVYCAYGNHTSAVQTDRAITAPAARQCLPEQPTGIKCDSLCCRAWVQMARSTKALPELAHHLPPDESMVKERCFGASICRAPAAEYHSCPRRSGESG